MICITYISINPILLKDRRSSVGITNFNPGGGFTSKIWIILKAIQEMLKLQEGKKDHSAF